jgi:hypothetical protein
VWYSITVPHEGEAMLGCGVPKTSSMSCELVTIADGLLPLTVPEVRRLLVALVWTAPVRPGFVLAWSRWRRRHQARARRAHYHRHERQVRLEY